LRVVAAFKSRSKPGRFSRALAPLIPLSSNSSTIRQPRASHAATSPMRCVSIVYSPVDTRKYNPTRLLFIAISADGGSQTQGFPRLSERLFL